MSLSQSPSFNRKVNFRALFSVDKSGSISIDLNLVSFNSHQANPSLLVTYFYLKQSIP
jgi:hypothetical protein